MHILIRVIYIMHICFFFYPFLGYKEKLGTSLSYEEILDARGLLKRGHLTNAGILLFAKYPTKFLPNARLRLLKFDGTRFETGK
mgnify:CR=1 FL=1